DCTHRIRGEAFDRRLRADRQERGRGDAAVRRSHFPAAGSAGGGEQTEGEDVGHLGDFRSPCAPPRWEVVAAIISAKEHPNRLRRCQAASSASSPLSNCIGSGGQPRICRSTGTTPETPPTTA